MTTPSDRQLVEWTERDFPGRTPGTRAAHTVGIGASGTFQPSRVMDGYSRAPQFHAGRIPVLARFSNGSGLTDERDLHIDARGLAVKLFPGMAVPPSGVDLRFGPDDVQADMVAMTLPVFFVKTGKDFEQLSEASIPVPIRNLRIGWLRRTIMKLRLEIPPGAPPDDVDRAIDPAALTKFAKEHPEAKSTIAALAGLINPTSYGRASYHGVHAFLMTGPDGVERRVRYRWEPLLGVRGVSAEQLRTLPDNHLHTDLRRRLANGTIQFSLELLVADAGDDTGDPTRPWPVQRPRISAGVLTLDRVVADQVDLQERVGFNPTRTLDGFVPCAEDDVLAARGRAYEFSCAQRGGTGCPVMH